MDFILDLATFTLIPMAGIVLAIIYRND